MFQQTTRLNKKQTAGNIKLTSPSTNCVKSKEASSKHGQSKSHERRKEGWARLWGTPEANPKTREVARLAKHDCWRAATTRILGIMFQCDRKFSIHTNDDRAAVGVVGASSPVPFFLPPYWPMNDPSSLNFDGSGSSYSPKLSVSLSSCGFSTLSSEFLLLFRFGSSLLMEIGAIK